jgi:diguanylate cyclase
MSDEAERWKEKYLKGIEQQDRLEARWSARLDLLRRGLVRSSLAAEGTDRAVDACMKEMREIVRKDDMDAGLAALIPRLEKAVLESEQRREVRAGQTLTALNALVQQLQALPLPRELRKPLKRFARNLEDRAAQARELPLLLSELSGLQGKALTILEKTEEGPRPGLLQRLFGGRETNAEAAPAGSASEDAVPPDVAVDTVEPPVVETQQRDDDEASASAEPSESPGTWATTAPADPPTLEVAPAHVPERAHASGPQSVESAAVEPAPEAPRVEPVEQAPVVVVALENMLAPTPVVPFEQRPAALTEAEAEPEAAQDESSDEDPVYALPSSPEPSYSSVAAHIEDTLLGLLNDLTLSEHHRPQVESMQHRLKHGLNWYELLPILDDLAVLMLAINNGEQQAFGVYLKELNERLKSFQSHLQAASDDHAENRTSARDLNEQLREQVGGLQSSVQDASDLTSLKQVLDARLEGLLTTVDDYQRKRDAREQEVAARLQGLAARVASMEQEAQSVRVHLEEQRQKALIDPLTGLPNRAAWGERLEHELAHWQQRKNSLLVCMLDLDRFKSINDGYGHLAGDKVLKIVANVLKKRLRTSDFLARFGGEEFVLLLPATPTDEGLTLLDGLRSAVEQCPFHFKGERVTITVSMGVTAFQPGERSDMALKRADQALYRAKEQGRNRIETG